MNHDRACKDVEVQKQPYRRRCGGVISATHRLLTWHNCGWKYSNSPFHLQFDASRGQQRGKERATKPRKDSRQLRCRKQSLLEIPEPLLLKQPSNFIIFTSYHLVSLHVACMYRIQRLMYFIFPSCHELIFHNTAIHLHKTAIPSEYTNSGGKSRTFMQRFYAKSSTADNRSSRQTPKTL